MDFDRALKAAQRDAGSRGVGTLAEKTLHLTMKYLFAPDAETHEKPIGAHIADALTEDGVIEVQTRSLYRLKPKLEEYLQTHPVTVVYPIAASTTLIRVNENGEYLGSRRSPKHETVYTAMGEIYHLRKYFREPGFRLAVVSLEMNAYLLEGAAKGKRKLDREPTALTDIRMLHSPADFKALLPELPAEFSVKELAAALHTEPDAARAFLGILHEMGAAVSEKREKRVKIWRILP